MTFIALDPYNVAGYGAPSRNVPQWYTGYAVFQNGATRQRTGSLTGGGQAIAKNWTGKFRPVVYVQGSPTNSLSGGGFIPLAPPGLTILQQNPSGNNGNGI
jgi:hypothetical protein